MPLIVSIMAFLKTFPDVFLYKSLSRLESWADVVCVVEGVSWPSNVYS